VPSHRQTRWYATPAHDPDFVDLDLQIGQDAAETLEPAAHGLFVVALTTERVGAGHAMVDMRRDCFQRFIKRWWLTWSKVCRIRFSTMLL
jgi:hypothetical protein